MTGQVVYDIFPDRGCAQHLYALGKAQGFADQAPIHMPRGQVGAFNVGRMVCRLPSSSRGKRLVKQLTGSHGEVHSKQEFDVKSSLLVEARRQQGTE
jgi:hypothetical protein